MHPSSSLPLAARIDLADAGTLYVTQSGARALEKRDGTRVVGAQLLPSGLTGALRLEDGSFVATDGDGRTMTFREPLGAASAPRAPSVTLHATTAGKRALLGLDGKGRLLRSVDAGATWSETPITGNERRVSLQMRGDGRGLLLLSPQRVLATVDDGASWAAIATPSVGAVRVSLDANDALTLHGVIGGAILKETPLRLDRTSRPGAEPTITLPTPADAMSVSWMDAIADNRAVLDGTRFIELVNESDGSFSLVIVPFSGVATRRKIAELDSVLTGVDPIPGHCDGVHLASLGTTIVAGCEIDGTVRHRVPRGSEPPRGRVLALFKSVDEGLSWSRWKLPDADGVPIDGAATVTMFALADGSIIVDGGCKPARTLERCGESAPVRVANGSVHKVLDRNGHITALHAVGEGELSIGIGLDFTDHARALVSKDGGKSFRSRPLPNVTSLDGEETLVPGVGGATIGDDGAGHPVIIAPAGCNATNSSGCGWLRYSSADHGETWTGSALVVDAGYVALAGRRGLALGYGEAWETADGGKTFFETLAPDPQLGKSTIYWAASCSTYGCIVGQDATRIGWDHDGAGPIVARKPVAPLTPAKERSSYKCVAESAWSPVGDVVLPTASDADKGGGQRWLLPHRDDVDGRIEAFAETTTKTGTERRTIALFPPAKGDVASQVDRQVEGVAAARFSFKREPPPKVAPGRPPTPPMPPPKPGTKGAIGKAPLPPVTPTPSKGRIVVGQTVDLELAWYVSATGKTHHATVKGFGPIAAGVDVREGATLSSSNLLLSIAQGGIYVRQRQASESAPVFFVKETGQVDKLAWPAFPTQDIAGRKLEPSFDAVHAGKRHMFFGLTGAQSTTSLTGAWSSDAGGYDATFWTVSTRVDSQILPIESSATPVLGVIFAPTTGFQSWAFAIPIESPTADPTNVVELPTLATMPDPLVGCSKLGEPLWRLVSPVQNFSHQLVTTEIDGTSVAMWSRNGIIRTSRSGPACVSVLDAAPVNRVGEWEYRALLLPGDLSHGNLFGRRVGGGSKTNELSVRPLRCELVPAP